MWKMRSMTAFAGDVSNKAFIVSDRCEIRIGSEPTSPVSEPALWTENVHQPSSNTTAASQRLNNLRLNKHTQHKSDEDVPANRQFLGQMPADCLHRSDPACLGYWKHFFPRIKMRGWVELLVQTHSHLPYLVPTAFWQTLFVRQYFL